MAYMLVEEADNLLRILPTGELPKLYKLVQAADYGGAAKRVRQLVIEHPHMARELERLADSLHYAARQASGAAFGPGVKGAPGTAHFTAIQALDDYKSGKFDEPPLTEAGPGWHPEDELLQGLTFSELIDTAQSNVGEDASPQQIEKEYKALVKARVHDADYEFWGRLKDIQKAVKKGY